MGATSSTHLLTQAISHRWLVAWDGEGDYADLALPRPKAEDSQAQVLGTHEGSARALEYSGQH